MTEKWNKEEGPLWQIEQQIKHYEGAALAHRADALRYQKMAEREEALASEYRRAKRLMEEND